MALRIEDQIDDESIERDVNKHKLGYFGDGDADGGVNEARIERFLKDNTIEGKDSGDSTSEDDKNPTLLDYYGM